MSLLDTENSLENIDYEVIYKKKFDEITERLQHMDELIDIYNSSLSECHHRVQKLEKYVMLLEKYIDSYTLQSIKESEVFLTKDSSIKCDLDTEKYFNNYY